MTREQALAISAPQGPTSGEVPDVFLIDADLDLSMGGLQLMSELNSRQATRHSATCIVIPEDEGPQFAMAFDLGPMTSWPHHQPARIGHAAADPVAAETAGGCVRASVEDGLRLAVIDPLTGVYNRGTPCPALPALPRKPHRRKANSRSWLSILTVQVVLNDKFGHAAGDCVLCEESRAA